MLHYINIMRPLNCLMGAIAVWIGSLVAGAALFPTTPAIYAMAAAFLICGAGMAINDYFDADIDKINKPKRPIPSGKMSRNTALVYSFLLFVAGIGFSYFINNNAFYVAIAVSIILALYAWKLKKIAVAGNVAVSVLVGLTFIYGGLAVSMFEKALMLALLAFFSNMAREIYKTIDDVMGDKQHGVNTLPVRIGVLKTRIIANIFVFIAVILSFAPFLTGMFGYVYLVFVSLADMLFVLSAFLPVKHGSKLCKFAMLVALISFLAGAIAS